MRADDTRKTTKDKGKDKNRGKEWRRRGHTRRQERALFALLVACPRAWTITELVSELSPPTLYLSAVAALSDAGLLHWQGEHIVPTLAAIRADELCG